MKNEKIKVIAITGRSGCGKSLAGQILRDSGRTVLDCDQIAAYVNTLPQIIADLAACFGADVVNPDGSLNRRQLASYAFANKDTQQKLIDITHPAIITHLLEKINNAAENGERFVYVDGAVIIGQPFEKYCDVFIVVCANEDDQIKRITKRDGITVEMAQNRLSRQPSTQTLKSSADYLVYNDTLGLLKKQILHTDEVIKEKYGET